MTHHPDPSPNPAPTIRPYPTRKTLHSVDSLIEAGLAAEQDRTILENLAQHYATAIPPAFQKLIAHPDDPIGKQVIPDRREILSQPYEQADPIGDDAHSPVPGIVHRYPDRALLKPLLVCPLYCRFCFRREHVGPAGGLLDENALETALRWIENHTAIQEIILTGGDPFMLSARRMRHIIRRLSSMAHITTIRLHTRVPFAAPERINDSFLDALESEKALFVAVHANHAREFSPEAKAALRRLLRRGIPLVSQSVLLRGVNDTSDALEALFRAFVQARVKPYYLHHLDNAPGTAHFQVPVEEGLTLLRSLRGRISGLAWPLYVLDIPGGKGKVPLGPDYLQPHNNRDNNQGTTNQARERLVTGLDGKSHKFTG